MARQIKLTPFGREVEKALIDKDMSKGDLARAIGISQPYLTDILKGTRVGTKRKKQIAEYLGLDLIVGGR
nr:helix-turn-helix transcriptional regulator [uncultured Cellulosilyticum sp.]